VNVTVAETIVAPDGIAVRSNLITLTLDGAPPIVMSSVFPLFVDGDDC